jgi:hypothetical protein
LSDAEVGGAGDGALGDGAAVGALGDGAAGAIGSMTDSR